MNATSNTQPGIHANRFLDARGLSCPLPILKTKVELARMQPGDVLQVLATDPMASLDFRAFCLRTGHDLLHLLETADYCEFLIRKV